MAKLTIEQIIASLKESTLVELNDLVKAIEEEFGVSAALPVAVAAADTGAADAPTEVNVVLTAAGDSKINVIKVVRELTGLGLMDAKKLVDNTPGVIKENVPVAEAEELKKKLVEVGATIEFK
ncbi:large subunit ribosomal protein L7/L12 [Mycoplasmoides fastidiosum]|uniref:Large ribosomal subunit protein bL12 n=1 Tax=Mycoplasmoides fastidiosum TaxID=92758 RepID=A0ABU0LZD9_9BACT|nr:50S ribosomal protein L7/L12 [Mycoplasmoides fastidiosum]MDQ0514066.1 large subunit ribosomal protein L7/L12 [Mycoplasmoides fastidiosum]UUD37523.1 50S ribosomal protein L7/L12 [Mycoplasmoides fastidiosum]